jgi:aminopeptidase N
MVIGPEAGERLWNDYEDRLQRAMNRCRILVARPPTCGEVDVLRDGLFCSIPYMKGAFFLKGVADQVGPEALDSALAAFYRERRGQAAGMSDLIETIAAQTGYDPAVCAAAWLGQAAIPAERSCPEASPTTR